MNKLFFTSLLFLSIALLASCGGGGGASPVAQVTLSGVASYDSVPVRSNGMGLDYNSTVRRPIRGAVVELLNSTSNVLATTATDSNGDYSFSVDVNSSVRVRVKARALQGGNPGWDIRVEDNTSNNSLYVLDGSLNSVGATDSSRDLHASSGINLATFKYDAARAAAPFAILDTIYTAQQTVLAIDGNIQFPRLYLGWSVNNIPANGNISAGLIGSTFFRAEDNRIYILGDADFDTDEFDVSVLAHEWGHYFLKNFSRDDSVGGEHGAGDLLDHRVAYSEGFATAWSGMVLDLSTYSDSFGNNQATSFFIDLESMAVSGTAGWFNEDSVTLIIFDLFDSNSDGSDSVNLELQAIINALRGALKDADTLVGIHDFISEIKADNLSAVVEINALVAAQNIVSATVDPFATLEVNDAGGDPDALPLYTTIIPDGAAGFLCVDSQHGIYNRLGNNRFIRVDLGVAESIKVTVSRNGSSSKVFTDPDFLVYSQGLVVGVGDSVNANLEVGDVDLVAGTHIIELYDYDHLLGNNGRSCFDIAIAIN